MSNRTKRKTGKQQRKVVKLANPADSALALRPEYKGQPVVAFKINGSPIKLTTTVTTGAITQSQALASTMIPSFSSRFAGFTEFRIVKAKARVRNFSSVNAGVGVMWFSEDDSSTPTTAKAQDAAAKKFSLSDISKCHEVDYVPHDPAQQTWTLVSSGTPTIGYWKCFSNNADFGASIVATDVAYVEFEFTVQFRGFI